MRWAVSTCESLIFVYVVQLNPRFLAGSTLLPSTMSGKLSGAVSPTGGRYGSVTIEVFTLV